MLTIRRLPVGPYQANAWIASDDARREAFLVDARAEPERLLKELEGLECTLRAILQTHACFSYLLDVGVKVTG